MQDFQPDMICTNQVNPQHTMPTSDKKLESKDQVDEVMPPIWSGQPDVKKLIYDFYYSFDGSPELLGKPFTFFGIDSTPKQALTIVRTAGPLDMLETIIKNKPQVLLEKFKVDGMEGTLLQLAIIGLDLTIGGDEGMTERLMMLHEKLLPDTQPEALKQARFASPLEDKEMKIERESKNLEALNHVFDAIKQADEKTAEAIEAFKEFVSSSKPEVMTDNRYNLNLLHLLYAAFNLLAERHEELKGKSYGAKTRRFCFEIIGAIQKALPNRTRQILMNGVANLFDNGEMEPRVVDRDGIKFLGVPGSKQELGVNCFYDDFELARQVVAKFCNPVLQFSKLMLSHYIRIQNLYESPALSSSVTLQIKT